jgi:hypothetical protein
MDEDGWRIDPRRNEEVKDEGRGSRLPRIKGCVSVLPPHSN